jgi:hypothetical protein
VRSFSGIANPVADTGPVAVGATDEIIVNNARRFRPLARNLAVRFFNHEAARSLPEFIGVSYVLI